MVIILCGNCSLVTIVVNSKMPGKKLKKYVKEVEDHEKTCPGEEP